MDVKSVAKESVLKCVKNNVESEMNVLKMIWGRTNPKKPYPEPKPNRIILDLGNETEIDHEVL